MTVFLLAILSSCWFIADLQKILLCVLGPCVTAEFLLFWLH
jgi:uncharacterized membrane protein YedE/YeeE